MLKKVQATSLYPFPGGGKAAKAGEAVARVMNVQDIMGFLPHRYPFLLIDRIDAHEHEVMARGVKLLSNNEWFFQGHFPERPELPNSILIEAMAQLGAAVIMASPANQGRYILFAALDNAEFGRPAVPGDCLEIEATMLNYRKDRGKTRIVARVGEEQLASADFVFAVSDQVEAG